MDSRRFVHDNGTGYLAFKSYSAGAITHVFAGAFWGWQRLGDH